MVGVVGGLDAAFEVVAVVVVVVVVVDVASVDLGDLLDVVLELFFCCDGGVSFDFKLRADDGCAFGVGGLDGPGCSFLEDLDVFGIEIGR